MTASLGDHEHQDVGASHADLAEQARRVAADPDLIVRAETGARLREEKVLAERRRNRRRRSLRWSISGVVAMVLVAVVFYFAARPGRPPEHNLPSPRNGAVLLSETVSQTHLTRKLMVYLGERGSFSVQLLVFDQNRFLHNNVVLSNPQVLENGLSSSRQELLGSSIVIFAAASMEGEPDDNLNLCRRRVEAVAAWLRTNLGAQTSSYWALPVGEYRWFEADKQVDEAAEDAAAADLGEERLAKQRQLIIVSIKANERSSQSMNRMVEGVVAQLRGAGYLPTGYDYGNSVPAPLSVVTTS